MVRSEKVRVQRKLRQDRARCACQWSFHGAKLLEPGLAAVLAKSRPLQAKGKCNKDDCIVYGIFPRGRPGLSQEGRSPHPRPNTVTEVPHTAVIGRL